MISPEDRAALEKKFPGMATEFSKLAAADAEVPKPPPGPADLDPAVAKKFAHEHELSMRGISDKVIYGGDPANIRPVLCYRCVNQMVHTLQATSTIIEGKPYHVFTALRKDIPEMAAQTVTPPPLHTKATPKNKDYTRSFFSWGDTYDLYEFLKYDTYGTLKWPKSTIHGHPPRYYAVVLAESLQQKDLQ